MNSVPAENSVFLIRPPSTAERAESKTFEHLGLGYLAAFLSSNGVQVQICDNVLYPESEADVVAKVSSGRYPLVGITVPSQECIFEVLKLAEAIKHACPDTHIALGGHFPSAAHDLLLQDFPYLDSVVRGEGEQPLLELAKSVLQGRDIQRIQGLTYRHNGQVVPGPHAKVLADLDAIPFPRRDFGPMEFGGIRYAPMVSSRGCPYKCNYCSINSFYDCTGWRGRSISKIADEMSELYFQEGCRGFDFSDDNFVPPGRPGIGRVEEFCNEIRSRGLRDLTLVLMMAPGIVNHNVISQLYEVGLRSVLVGIESASPSVLKRLKKATTPSINERALDVLRHYDLAVSVGLIMFDPDTTVDDIKTNIAFLKPHVGYLTFEPLNRLQVYYGTAIYHGLAARGRLTGTYLAPQYDFAEERVAWLYDVSVALMQERLGQISEWARGLTSESATVPLIFRLKRRQQTLGFVFDILNELVDFAESQARLPDVEKSVEMFSEAVDYGLDYLAEGIGMRSGLPYAQYSRSEGED